MLFWLLQQLSGTELVERDELLAGFEQTLLEKEDKLKVVCSQLITLQEAVKTYKSEVRMNYVQNYSFWEHI